MIYYVLVWIIYYNSASPVSSGSATYHSLAACDNGGQAITAMAKEAGTQATYRCTPEYK